MSRGAPRMQFARKAGGSLCVEIVTPDKGGDSWVELVRRDAEEKPISGIAVQAEELERLISGLTECRNVLKGHPRHQAKETI